MHEIQKRIEAVRVRQQRQWLWQNLSVGLVAGGAVGCGFGLLRLMGIDSVSLPWIAAAMAICPALALLYGCATSRRTRQAAVAIDRQYGLKDRMTTAMNFLLLSSPTPAQRLQLDDATSHAATVDPIRVAPIRAPRSWGWGLLLCTAAVLIAYVARPREQVSAAVVQDEVVLDQALRMAEELKELEQFEEASEDPELRELLNKLAEKIEQLKQPGVDPKEALAKLSEMEAALQQKQQQLADPNMEAALQQIGEALTLAEPLQAAGQAMSEGNMEQAAEELAKADLPQLDRQTERAVTEKLQQAQQNQSQGAARQLQQATGKVSEGLTQGDRSKFKEGMQGLAGECKKQGKKKKLMDLLRKQCSCLSECKSQCEGACKSDSESKKKGGKGWGLGRSGNDPGDPTAKLKTSPQMQVTGIESDSGEADVETTSAPEQQQEAVREYREKVEKYEQLSESVLESEPIPLGHRQTIRRYFELIRPQDGETDAVQRELSAE